jgi:hypothetical protein
VEMLKFSEYMLLFFFFGKNFSTWNQSSKLSTSQNSETFPIFWSKKPQNFCWEQEMTDHQHHHHHHHQHLQQQFWSNKDDE